MKTNNKQMNLFLDNASKYFNLAVKKDSNSYYLQSANWSKKALKLEPSNLEALLWDSLSLLNLNKNKEALRSLDRTIKLYPNDFRALQYKAHYFENKEKNKEAIKYYLKALKVHKKNCLIKKCHNEYSLLNEIGDYYNNIKKYKVALAFFEKAIKLYPSKQKAIVNKWNVFNESGIYNNWFYNSLNIVLKEEPNNQLAIYHKFDFLVDKEKFPQAKNWFMNLFKLHKKECPEKGQCLFDEAFEKGINCFKMKKFKQALFLFDLILEQSKRSNLVNVLIWKIKCLKKLRDYSGMIIVLNELIRLDKKNKIKHIRLKDTILLKFKK